jgi:hypothetical protein
MSTPRVYYLKKTSTVCLLTTYEVVIIQAVVLNGVSGKLPRRFRELGGNKQEIQNPGNSGKDPGMFEPSVFTCLLS